MELDMYAETLIYAYEHPQHKGVVKEADATMQEENISCGDRLTIYMKLEKGKISEIKFDGVGCVISMGSADILAGHLRGMKVEDALAMSKEDLLKVINIDPGPVRLHCATLSLRATKKALFLHENRPVDAKTKEL